jgi:hypothetical protein
MYVYYYSFAADRMKSDTGGWVEYTKAMEEYSWRNSAK